MSKYFKNSQLFIGCDMELVTNKETFRGSIKSITQKDGRIIFELCWIARLVYLRGWIITNQFSDNVISFVTSKAGAVGSFDEGKSVSICVAELLGNIHIFPKAENKLKLHDIHDIDCTGGCLNCVNSC